VTLDTERLTLRWMHEADADALFAMSSVPEVMRYTPRPPMKERAEAEQMLARVMAAYADGSGVQLGMVRKSDSALIGTCVLFNIHETSRRAELGYMLNRSYWGQASRLPGRSPRRPERARCGRLGRDRAGASSLRAPFTRDSGEASPLRRPRSVRRGAAPGER
jgi:hypothetical protein